MLKLARLCEVLGPAGSIAGKCIVPDKRLYTNRGARSIVTEQPALRQVTRRSADDDRGRSQHEGTYHRFSDSPIENGFADCGLVSAHR